MVHRWLGKLLGRMFALWLMFTAFFAFLIFAECNYDFPTTWQALAMVSGAGRGHMVPGGLPRGVGPESELFFRYWLFFTALVALLTLGGVSVIQLWQWRRAISLDRLDAYRGAPGGNERKSIDIYALPVQPGPPAGGSVASQLSSGLAWACVLLAAGSLGLCGAALFFGVVLEPPAYWVPVWLAIWLGVLANFRMRPAKRGGGPATESYRTGRLPSFWRERFFSAPLWLRLALVAVGIGTAVVCAHAAYITWTNPTLYDRTVGSASLALIAALLFLADATTLWG